MLANNAALGLVDESDVTMLRELASDGSVTPDGATRTISLGSGAQLEAQIERLTGASNGAIIRLTPRRPSAHAKLLTGGIRYDVADDEGERPAAAVASFHHIYVGGETGTGRTTTAHALAQGRPVTSMDARDSLADGSERWAQRLSSAAKEQVGTLVVESVHVLSPELIEFVEGVLGAAPDKTIVLTGHADKWLPPHMRGLLARCDHVISLSPLLGRRNDIPALAASMLSTIDPDHDRRLSPAATRILMAQPWPGNLSELKKVLRTAVSQRTVGAIEVGDLPLNYRSRPTPKLAGREQAEREVIIDALRRFNDNKTHAAKHLGITRTTLYNRIRALKITDQTV
ncbi:helix-turn-helix domain-containing protein [Arthrobacter sp. efr-133-TYG-118]|uniref:helix-turn-helix domain-containing protein n=1 Tax=Arthrobacter sp. efr-133-TYG-118 TaxID=3040279 RepID=UPI00254F466A|nr:helix-turn-helix domain-containing protein [Arthrobacter sp. efr-133-TYG-118]